MTLEVEPIGRVCSTRSEARDDDGSRVECSIELDGTPVLDIKPVFREFLPREPMQQPAWVGELMQHYWSGQAQAPAQGALACASS